MDYKVHVQIFPSWFEPVIQNILDFISRYPSKVITVALSCLVIFLLFKKIVDPLLYEFYKSVLQYEVTLQMLKDELEKDFQDYQWSDPNFCKAYFAMYSAYRELRMMAKRNYRGQIYSNDRRWIQFDYLKLVK